MIWMIANPDGSNQLLGDTCETVRVWLETRDCIQLGLTPSLCV